MKDIEIPEGKRFEIRNYLDGDFRKEMIKDISEGMTQSQKFIPSKYFYDANGSHLFEQICSTPEYYPTRTEFSILGQSAPQIMKFFSKTEGDLIELGSGSHRKIRKLLDAVPSSRLSKIRYVPVDISESALLDASKNLSALYEDLKIFGIIADFTRHVDVIPQGRKLITFLGSTIGNFTDEEGMAFLKSVKGIMNPDDRFLLGMDLLKPFDIIEAAYNDEMGLTRAFNLNVLTHINRELNADFNPDNFEHLAFFNAKNEQMEMHLRARCAVRVSIADLSLSVDFRGGETIHTETSRKFHRESADRKFKKAGLSVAEWFTDPKGWFSLTEVKTANC